MKNDISFDLRMPVEMAKVAEQAGVYKVSKRKALPSFWR
ncbi:hypothetical protein FHR25_004124 [Yokenella regensburgei]|nr:hypothetical protein FHR25_004124 [Yokenella regensburgei]